MEQKKQPGSERYMVPAVEQASRVLFCLAGHSSSHMSLTEICAQVGIHKSKAYSILQTLQGSGLRSPTLERSLALRKADELGLMPDDDAERTNVEDELTAAAMTAKAAVFKAQLDAVAAAAAAGANELQAAIELGMDPAVARRLFGDQSGTSDEDEETPPALRAVP